MTLALDIPSCRARSALVTMVVPSIIACHCSRRGTAGRTTTAFVYPHFFSFFFSSCVWRGAYQASQPTRRPASEEMRSAEGLRGRDGLCPPRPPTRLGPAARDEAPWVPVPSAWSLASGEPRESRSLEPPRCRTESPTSPPEPPRRADHTPRDGEGAQSRGVPYDGRRNTHVVPRAHQPCSFRRSAAAKGRAGAARRRSFAAGHRS